MNRRIIINISIALLVSLSVIIVLGSFMKEKISINEILSNEVLELILIGLVINTGCILIDGFKLHMIVSAFKEKIRYKEAIESCLIYSFFSAITPSSTGGQPFQMYFLIKKGVRSEVAADVILFRTFEYMLILLGIDLYGITFIIPKLSHWPIGKTMTILGFISSIFSVSVMWITMTRPEIYKHIISRIKKIKRLAKYIEKWEDKTYNWLDNLKLSTNSLLENKKIIVLDFILMLVLVLLYSYQLFLPLTRLTGIGINFFTFFGIQTLLSSLAAYVPTPGASGSLEVILYSSLKDLTFSPKLLLVGITIYRITTYYSIILGGIPIILKNQGLIYRGKRGSANNL